MAIFFHKRKFHCFINDRFFVQCSCFLFFRSASPRLVLEQPRSSSPFHNKISSEKQSSATAKRLNSDSDSISSASTGTVIAASVKTASALMQRDYLKEIASPKMVSPTRLRKFGGHNKPGSADKMEETS